MATEVKRYARHFENMRFDPQKGAYLPEHDEGPRCLNEEDFITAAKTMHALRCNRLGIWQKDKIASYWEAVDQQKYIREAMKLSWQQK